MDGVDGRGPTYCSAATDFDATEPEERRGSCDDIGCDLSQH